MIRPEVLEQSTAAKEAAETSSVEAEEATVEVLDEAETMQREVTERALVLRRDVEALGPTTEELLQADEIRRRFEALVREKHKEFMMAQQREQVLLTDTPENKGTEEGTPIVAPEDVTAKWGEGNKYAPKEVQDAEVVDEPISEVSDSTETSSESTGYIGQTEDLTNADGTPRSGVTRIPRQVESVHTPKEDPVYPTGGGPSGAYVMGEDEFETAGSTETSEPEATPAAEEEGTPLKSAAEIAMEKTEPAAAEPEETTQEAPAAEEKSGTPLKSTVEIAMEKTEQAANTQEEPVAEETSEERMGIQEDATLPAAEDVETGMNQTQQAQAETTPETVPTQQPEAETNQEPEAPVTYNFLQTEIIDRLTLWKDQFLTARSERKMQKAENQAAGLEKQIQGLETLLASGNVDPKEEATLKANIEGLKEKKENHEWLAAQHGVDYVDRKSQRQEVIDRIKAAHQERVEQSVVLGQRMEAMTRGIQEAEQTIAAHTKQLADAQILLNGTSFFEFSQKKIIKNTMRSLQTALTEGQRTLRTRSQEQARLLAEINDRKPKVAASQAMIRKMNALEGGAANAPTEAADAETTAEVETETTEPQVREVGHYTNKWNELYRDVLPLDAEALKTRHQIQDGQNISREFMESMIRVAIHDQGKNISPSEITRMVSTIF